MIDETIKALPDGKRMAYVEGHIADYLLAGFTTDDLARVTAERDAWRDAIGKLASTPQAFCPADEVRAERIAALKAELAELEGQNE